MGDPRTSAALTRNDGDGRIGDHLRMKGRRIDHIDVDFQMELLGNEVPKRPAIAVLHPAVRTDKSENAAIRQRSQRPFDKRDVEIGPVVDRCVARAVFCQQDIGNPFLPHIRGVADHDIEGFGKISQQEIVIDQPRISQRDGLRSRKAASGQQVDDLAARLREGLSMKLDRTNSACQSLHRYARIIRGVPRCQKPLDSRQQEVPAAKRRFKELEFVQRTVGLIPAEIEEELDDFAACKYGTARFDACVGCKYFDSLRDRAKSRQGRLPGGKSPGTLLGN
ncbi:hypothetical protein STPYR_10806 [uncultured Stenotrophomonas sp.]|uniref:Uncharacterized protein n=1 Tax=uncultured Stenotrophomonas sp. TaxID=165438 RepID=A0A1Y5Q4R1_9GAMM|nr:hypothetical protein STPYR_10806 [uncultured Stenotrophomonas sp.]